MTAREVARATGAAGPVIGSLTGAHGVRLRTLSWMAARPEERVLVVHGLGEHAGRYHLLADALTRRGYSLLAYDQRGHGRSEGRRGHVARFDVFLEDLHLALAEAQRRLPGSGSPFLLGHSLGGLVLLRYLQTYRPTAPGAVLSAPWLATAHVVPPWKRALASLLAKVAPGLALPEPVPPEHLTRDVDQARERERDALVHPLISAGLWAEIGRAQERAAEQGIEPTVPTLALVPDDDKVVDAARTLRWARGVAAPHVDVVELPGRRHEPFNDVGRDEVFDLLAVWLDAHRRREPPRGARVSPLRTLPETDVPEKIAPTMTERDDDPFSDDPGTATDDVAAEEEAGSGEASDVGEEGTDPSGAELRALNDRHLRLAAEFQNYRRRVEGDMAEAWARAQADLVGRMLDVLDDLQRVSALDPSQESVSTQSIVEGVDLVERKFLRTLGDAGVEAIDPRDETFDPECMEAVMRVPTDEAGDDDRVQEVFQKGYRLRGHLVRPARVSVLKHG